MFSSPFEVGRESQQLSSGAREATSPSDFPDLTGDLPIMLTIWRLCRALALVHPCARFLGIKTVERETRRSVPGSQKKSIAGPVRDLTPDAFWPPLLAVAHRPSVGARARAPAPAGSCRGSPSGSESAGIGDSGHRQLSGSAASRGRRFFHRSGRASSPADRALNQRRPARARQRKGAGRCWPQWEPGERNVERRHLGR
jgi:hypothetical protein